MRERGELEEWIQFFLTAVSVQARDAVERAERLADLREDYRRLGQGSRSRLPEVVELLFENPVITAGYVSARLDVTQQGAMNLIRRLETDGVVTELRRVPGRSKRWRASQIIEVLEGAAR